VVLPSQNLQHAITYILLCCTTGVNEQFPGRDFNPLDTLPMTAGSLTPFLFIEVTELKAASVLSRSGAATCYAFYTMLECVILT
ncbi:hypothetical protein MNBD_GAMMA18-492, partial [hydrothermal vent metagenome]